jgi:predicted enzyme related to lactoylglutathione lyase
MSVICGDCDATAERVKELGGTLLKRFDKPLVIVMADPEGNEFCLVPPPGA